MGGDFLCYVLAKKSNTSLRYNFPDERIAQAAKVLSDAMGLDEDSTTEPTQRIHDALENVKIAMEKEPRDVAIYVGKEYTYLVTGGISWGDSPTDTYQAIDTLVQAELIYEVGFEQELP